MDFEYTPIDIPPRHSTPRASPILGQQGQRLLRRWMSGSSSIHTLMADTHMKAVQKPQRVRLTCQLTSFGLHPPLSKQESRWIREYDDGWRLSMSLNSMPANASEFYFRRSSPLTSYGPIYDMCSPVSSFLVGLFSSGAAWTGLADVRSATCERRVAIPARGYQDDCPCVAA